MTAGRRRQVGRCLSSWRALNPITNAIGHIYVPFTPKGSAPVATIALTGALLPMLNTLFLCELTADF